MKEDQININVDSTTEKGEIVIRHGAAIPLKDLLQIAIVGEIFAPLQFFKARKHLFFLEPVEKDLPTNPEKNKGRGTTKEGVSFDNMPEINTTLVVEEPSLVAYHPDKCYLTINEENGIVVLVVDENNPYQHRIEGRIRPHKIIADLQLNQDTYLEPKDLCKKLRRYRYLADNLAEFDLVCKNLNEFKGQFVTEFDKSNDKKGGVANSIVRKLTSEHGLDFSLEFAVFNGTEKVKLDFITEIDYTDKGVLICSLYCPELENIQEVIKKRIFEEYIQAFSDITVINI